MSRKQPSAPAGAAKRWPVILVAAVILFAIVMVVMPKRSQNLPSSGAAPLFTKQGTVSLLNREGKTLATVDVEVADNDAKREVGLMGRPSMEDRQGLYFIFEAEHMAAFWMKNTIIPLDIIFINANHQIITIHRNTTPYSEQTYAATAPAQYVLEVNAGFCDKYGVREGDTVEFRKL